MATPAQRTNTWILNEWYDQSVAGTTGGYKASLSGELYTWGNNSQGVLGQNNLTQYSSPRQVPGTTWVDISFGAPSNDTMATKSDGTLWMWGDNKWGALGQNQAEAQLDGSSSPVQVGTDTNWGALSDEDPMGLGKLAIWETALAIKEDGTLWSWGVYTAQAQNDEVHRSSPTQVGTETTWKSVATANPGSAGGLKTDGTLWTWGDNNSGQLGQNQASAQLGYASSPMQVPGTWSSFDVGEYANGGIKTDGTLWMFGSNSRGELGRNDGTWQNRRSSPVQVPGTTWSKLSVGEFQVAAIKTDGTLWEWGMNEKGQLGLNQGPGGQPGSYSSPTQVGTDTTWSDVNLQGAQGTFATKTDGTLWSWGYNYGGRLGHNSQTSRSSPTQIPGTPAIYRLGGGQYNSALIRA